VGLIMMFVVLVFALGRRVHPAHADRVKVLAMYWHFVDAVWVVVFSVVYLIGR
jgi:cytochrome c oxidase subunit 3/cytochrome o ubiquinol oxidase subunit 3